MEAPASEQTIRLDDPVGRLPGIGPQRAGRLQAAGITTVQDLLRRLPRGFREPARDAAEADLRIPGPPPPQGRSLRLRLRARVLSASLWPPGGRRSVLTLRLRADLAPEVPLRAYYYSQPYLKKNFPPGREAWWTGPLAQRKGLALISPAVADEDLPPAGPEPIYDEVEGLAPAVLRRALRAALPAAAAWAEPFTPGRLAAAGLPPLSEAIRMLHAPADFLQIERSRRRLAVEEVLRLEQLRRAARAEAPVAAAALAPAVWSRIRARLPFALNDEQETALAALRVDLESGRGVRRLLHGEVGSGKTAVAFALALAVIAGSGQAAMLAPTEILARQHLARFRAWLRGSRTEVVGLLGDDGAAARAAARARLASGRPLLAVGTHALCAPGLRFARLRLVVFDEQHRFGVRQKAALLAKGEAPHVLTMSATPIPRTLAWARHGGLDALILRGRAGTQATVETRVLDAGDWLASARALRPALERGERAFFVTPRIDGAGGLHERVAALSEGPWRGLPLALAHGRLAGAEIEREVERFRAGAVAALCGTTVVEVGLDVPGVGHMLVTGAERLGLASLHQLRGRLARGAGARAGVCLLFAPSAAHERLAILARCDDGFRVAEADLAARGPGSLQGVRQHGATGFRRFDPERDADLVAWVRAGEAETRTPLED